MVKEKMIQGCIRAKRTTGKWNERMHKRVTQFRFFQIADDGASEER
jgi:hypothetical protein